MKKRKLFLGVLLASAAFSMAACNNNTSKTDNDADKSSDTSGDQQVTKYTVTFNSNGGTTVDPQEIDENGKATQPTAPTKAADAAATYTFAGWYKDTALTQAFDFNTAITAATTLYAKWTATPVEYSVTFNSNGGTEVTAQSIAYGQKATQPTNPTKADSGTIRYAFAGWFKEAALTTEFDFDTDTITAATTLYAKWNETEQISVIFNSNGGTNVAQQLIFPGETATEPTAPTKANDSTNKYAFAGWYKDADFTEEFDFTQAINVTTTIYAKWTATPLEVYTVTFNSNGGTDVESQQITEGGKVTKPTNPTKESSMTSTYKFSAWYKDEALTQAFDFNTDTITTATTLYAKWTETARTWFALSVDSTNVQTSVEVGNKLDLEGLVVTATDNKAQVVTLSDEYYTVTVKDPSDNAFDINNNTTATGTYVVTVAMNNTTLVKTFNVTVTAAQYTFNFNLTAHDYNQSLETPYDKDYVYPENQTFELFDNKSLALSLTTKSGNNQVKFQLGQPKELDGTTFNDRFSIHAKYGYMSVTAKKSGKITVYCTVGGTDRKVQIKDGSDLVTEGATDWDSQLLYKLEFDAEAGHTYTINSSANGALIYAIYFSGSINESERIETDEFEFVPTGTQFDIQDDVFDTANIQGVATAWDNCSVSRTVALSDITFTVKDASENTVTGTITTPGFYTVTAAYGGKTVTYQIVVEDKNAEITAVQVDSTEATKKFYEGGAAFNANNITVTATKGVTITLDESDYEVKLYKGETEVTSFDTTGEYSVRVYAKDTEVYGSYTVNYYQITSTTITAGDSATIKVGTTSFTSGATAKLVYADATTKDVTSTIVEKYYSDATCTTETTTPFATAGTVYLKLTVPGAEKVITITVAELEKVSYNYDKTASNYGISTAEAPTAWTTTSVDGEGKITAFDVDSDGNKLIKLLPNASVTVTFEAATNMIDIALTGRTSGSSAASDYLKIEFLDADGNVIGTVIGTTTAGKVVGDFTFKAYDGATSFTFTSATACKSIRFSGTTSGKSVGIATASIDTYVLAE